MEGKRNLESGARGPPRQDGGGGAAGNDQHGRHRCRGRQEGNRIGGAAAEQFKGAIPDLEGFSYDGDKMTADQFRRTTE